MPVRLTNKRKSAQLLISLSQVVELAATTQLVQFVLVAGSAVVGGVTNQAAAGVKQKPIPICARIALLEDVQLKCSAKISGMWVASRNCG